METATTFDASFALAATHPDAEPDGVEPGKRATARLVELNAGCLVSFPLHAVHAVLEMPAPVPVLGMAPHGYGLLAWQGGHIPMIDLYALVYGTAATGSVRYALVLGYRDAGGVKKFGAISVPALPVNALVTNDDQCGLPTDSLLWRKFAISCFAREGKAVPVIDVARVMGFRDDAAADCTAAMAEI